MEARKHKTDVETLKVTKDKTEKEAGEVSMRADAAIRRAKDVEAALKGAIKENSWLLDIQEAQAARIKELEALLTKNKATIETAEKKTVEVRVVPRHGSRRLPQRLLKIFRRQRNTTMRKWSLLLMLISMGSCWFEIELLLSIQS